jgi:predicted nucleotide-binding protein (sugar kinase/HSP70/actin superfamily)
MTSGMSPSSVTESNRKTPLKVGIPRALYFYKYGSLWKAFLERLNCEVVFSPSTTSEIVEAGTKVALSELCIPMKIYFGHIHALLEENTDLDFIFIPRYISSHKDQFFCPKFLILPEAIQFDMKPSVPILTLEINAKKRNPDEGIIEFGEKLGFDPKSTLKAWEEANEVYRIFQATSRNGDYINLLNDLDPNPKHRQAKRVFKNQIAQEIQGKFPVHIALIGHPYNVYEAHINNDLIARLQTMDCKVLTIEQLPEEEFLEPITIGDNYHQYWQSEDEILKTARYVHQSDSIDGVIFLISFACGPDSLIEEIVMRDVKDRKIPYLALILDEHSGESGMMTRIESFVDMIRRVKYA